MLSDAANLIPVDVDVDVGATFYNICSYLSKIRLLLDNLSNFGLQLLNEKSYENAPCGIVI